MISIVKAKGENAGLLAEIGRLSFIESHGTSASATDIEHYVAEKYTDEEFRKELSDPENIYHIIYYDKRATGYSKIIFNAAHPNISIENVTKMERIYFKAVFNERSLRYHSWNPS